MGYGCVDSFPFNLEPNGIKFGSKLKGKLSPQPYLIRFERKLKYSFLSVSGKTTAIRRTAVRETVASFGMMGNQLKAPLKPLRLSQYYRM